MSHKDDVKKLILNNERRLQKLKEQQASFGPLHTPPHILVEIEDTQTEIQTLQTELEALEDKRIAEPTLEHYIYYLRHAVGDDNSAIQERRAAFAAELGELLAHLEHLSGQTIPAWEWPQESENRYISQRIVRTDWLDNQKTGRSYFVEARTYGDVYWLQVGYYQSGQTETGIFAGLRDEAWQPSATDHLLGISDYLCGIVAEDVDELAAQTMRSYTDGASGALVSTSLANDYAWLYGSSRYPNVTVLFYPNPECEGWVGQNILNNIALRLELYKHKTHRQLSWCDGAFQLLSEQERLLSDCLKEVRRASSSEINLFQTLIRLYLAFNGNVGLLAERQTTIGINLDNLDFVLKELGALTGDYFLGPMRNHLWQRQKQLEANLKYADQLRQQADAVIAALKVGVALDGMVDIEATSIDTTSIESTAWPGLSPTIESEMEGFTSYQKPSQPVTYPQINIPPHISLTAEEKVMLQHVYRGLGQVLVEKEFGSGYSGARVLRIKPVRTDNIPIARKVTKLGSAPGLYRECDNYVQYVAPSLPHCAARVEWENYSERAGQAGLTYIFMGGSLEQSTDLAEYYRRESLDGVEQILRMLDNLLHKELGQRWYNLTAPLICFFAAEYGPRMIEHLRLKLRPESTDTLWLVGQTPPTTVDHRQIETEVIPRKCGTIEPGALVSIEGLRIRRIKPDQMKLEDPEGQGIIVGVKFAPKNSIPQNLMVGDVVGVRGEVVYNQHARMKQIIADAFSEFSIEVGGKYIRLPGVTETYPNPLKEYPHVLGRALEGKQSYVHGDLHVHNVLVDEWGKGWLIDFARVKEQHNIFDFIKLETSLRQMVLAEGEFAFSLNDYVQFEEALVTATLGDNGIKPPQDPHLRAAYETILAIRRIAKNYMAPAHGFLNEYFPALFLYCLSVIKYHQSGTPQPTRLVFITASVLMSHLLG